MKITPELQTIIDSEVTKREMLLESKYREHFDVLKTEMYDTLKDYTKEALSKKIQLESINNSCEQVYYKPIVEGIIGLLKNNGIKINLQESINNAEVEETKTLLLEAVHKIQELRDVIRLHEMIETSLTGMNRKVVETTLARFRNDPKFEGMPKDDLLKEVAKYVTNMKDGVPADLKTAQFESESIDTSSLDEIDTILESRIDNTDPFTSKFNPANKINVSKLKKSVLDEAYAIKNTNTQKQISSEDPAQEVLDILGM